MGALQLLLVAVYAALSLYLVFSKPLQLPYSLHPIGTTLFIVLTTLGVSTSQTIRGKVAASKSSRYSATLKHAVLNWLAFFSLAGAQAAIWTSRERLGRLHLQSRHGMAGAATGLFFFQTLVAGASLVAVPSLYPKFVKVHRFFGYFTYLGVVANHASAVNNGYLTKDVTEKTALLVLLAAQVAVTLSAVQRHMLPFGRRKAVAQSA